MNLDRYLHVILDSILKRPLERHRCMGERTPRRLATLYAVVSTEKTMKKKTDKSAEEHQDDWEPPWLNPANDRQTPYTEEELELVAEGFIASMSDTEKLKSMIENEGIDKVKEIVKDQFRKRDENNLINIMVKGSTH